MRLIKHINFLVNLRMSKSVIQPINNFDFSKLTLSQPYSIQGGSYFTKLLNNSQQLYIQCPKCFTKQGIVNSNQKIYTDLLLNQSDNKFIEWFENLEITLQKLIYEKKHLWFHNDLDMSDIESAFTSPIKLYKSGKNYLIRCNLGRIQGLNFESPIRIFNENEVDIKLKDITSETPIISILEISGLRFSSRSCHALHLMVARLFLFRCTFCSPLQRSQTCPGPHPI